VAAALIAAAALIGLPAPASSTAPSPDGAQQAATFLQVAIPTGVPASSPAATLDAALRSDGYLGAATQLVERGSAPSGPTKRPSVTQPSVSAGMDWKPPLYKLTGTATFYDNGTTAMRLPMGTVVRICGAAGAQIDHPHAQPGFRQQVGLVNRWRIVLRARPNHQQDIQGMDHGTMGRWTRRPQARDQKSEVRGQAGLAQVQGCPPDLPGCPQTHLSPSKPAWLGATPPGFNCRLWGIPELKKPPINL